MQEGHKKLLLQSNKELIVYGDIEVLLLLHMDVKIGRPAFDSLMQRYFGKEQAAVQGMLDESYLQLLNQNSHST